MYNYFLDPMAMVELTNEMFLNITKLKEANFVTTEFLNLRLNFSYHVLLVK